MQDKRRDASLLVFYLTMTAFFFFLFLKCSQAQTVNDYLISFQNDARTYNISLKSPPILIVQETRLYINSGKERFEAEAYQQGRNIYFNRYSDMYEDNCKVLVYHELGHYYLNRPHTTENSIMNYRIWWNTDWESLTPETQTFYIEELFK